MNVDLFNQALKGPWETIGDDLQFKVEDRVLFFQCSDSESDWKYNLDFPAEPYRDCGWFVHGGFKDIWKSGEDAILPILLSGEIDLVTGFSHGGPAAILAHEAFWWHNQEHIPTITFGCPPVTWGKAPSRWERTTNYQVRGDIVTYLPPWYSLPGERVLIGPPRFPWITGHMPAAYRRYL